MCDREFDYHNYPVNTKAGDKCHCGLYTLSHQGKSVLSSEYIAPPVTEPQQVKYPIYDSPAAQKARLANSNWLAAVNRQKFRLIIGGKQ